MKLSNICPSLALGFYLSDRDAFERFRGSVERVRSQMGIDACFFSVFQERQNSNQYMMDPRKRMMSGTS